MSTFTMSEEVYDNTEEYAPRAIVPEAVGALIEIQGVDQFQGKKDPGKEFVVVRMVTEVDGREYKFDQFFTVMKDDEPNKEGQERLSRFIKNINRGDIITRDSGMVTMDWEALSETTFVADIRHGGDDPDKPFINLYSIAPDSHPKEDGVSEELQEEAPEPKAEPAKPGRLRKPGARR